MRRTTNDSSRRLACTAIALFTGSLLTSCAPFPRGTGREAVQAELETRLGPETSLEVSAAEAYEQALADGVLDPDEAVRLAIAGNQQLHAILRELDIARAELWHASLLPNPVVEAELQFIEAGGGDVLELGVAQDILHVLLLPRRRQIAGERFEQVKAEVTAAVIDLATEVRVAYRRLQAQEELVGLYRTAVEAFDLSHEAARRLREAGNIRELDVLREQVMLEDSKVALSTALVQAKQHRENVNALLGLWGSAAASWSIPPRLPTPSPTELDPERLESEVIARSLDLRGLQHRIVALGQAAGVDRLEALFPEATGGAIGEREPDETWSVGPRASLALPLFDFGQAANAEARARLEQAYAQYTDLAVRLRHAARSAYLESTTSGENSRFLREVVIPLRSRVTERTQLQFNAMQLGVFQLLEARRQELDAARRYVESSRDHWIARSRLEALLFGRLPEMRFGIATPSGGASGRVGSGGNGGH